MRKINQIIVHVSDSPDSRADVNAAVIRAWHLERGFSDIGYHKVALRNGVLEDGRPEEQVGAHCKGHNARSLGICWVGRDEPTADQYASMVDWCAEKALQHGLAAEDVRGHREVAPLSGKTCPNINMGEFRIHVANRMRARKHN